MDKKITLVSLIALAVISYFLFFQGNNEIKAPTITTPQNTYTQKHTIQAKTEELKIKTEQNLQTTQNNYKNQQSNENFNQELVIQNNIENNTQKDNNEQTTTDKKNKFQEIKKYLIQNHFKKIKVNKKVTIYYKNPPEKQSEFIPPALPTMINVKINKTNIPVVIDSNIIQNNKEIYVEKDNKIVKVDLKPSRIENETQNSTDNEEVKEKNIKIITPPAIGQN